LGEVDVEVSEEAYLMGQVEIAFVIIVVIKNLIKWENLVIIKDAQNVKPRLLEGEFKKMLCEWCCRKLIGIEVKI
jgi:hypothetical protein